MKKTRVKDMDVYEPTETDPGNTTFYDPRDDFQKRNTPECGVEIESVNGKMVTKLVCFKCKLKTTDEKLFMNHKCEETK